MIFRRKQRQKPRTAARQNGTESRKKRLRLLAAGGLLVFAAALAIAGLRRLPFSLSEVVSIVRQAGGTNSGSSAAGEQNRPLLRGTIYDRNLEELAVSYQFVSLVVHPNALANRKEAADKLALLLGLDSAAIFSRLQTDEPFVELPAELDAGQAAEAAALRQPGIEWRTTETRYYPGHAAAGHLLGFANKSMGLSGAEALYDAALQPGEFREINLPELKITDQNALGRTAADVVLAIDMRLQKRLEQMLKSYRKQTGAAAGSIVALNPDSGELLAFVRQPGFDPNYFWQTNGRPEDAPPLLAADFLPELISPLLADARNIEAEGISGKPLPATVSAPERSLTQEELNQTWQQFGLDQSVQSVLPADPKPPEAAAGAEDSKSAVQLAAGLATLFNSGCRVTPWLLKALYNHDHKRFLTRDPNISMRTRVLQPAEGVHLRWRLLHHPRCGSNAGFLFANTATAVRSRNGLSEQSLQDAAVAVVPGSSPVLLLLAIDWGSLYPQPAESESTEAFGRRLLALLTAYKLRDFKAAAPPAAKNDTNLRRFLLERRLALSPDAAKHDHAATVMPKVIGLSLRQGLQRLNLHKLVVRVRGSGGRIVVQQPAAGISLAKIKVCELTLASPARE